jgi:hypothetical protein
MAADGLTDLFEGYPVNGKIKRGTALIERKVPGAAGSGETDPKHQ